MARATLASALAELRLRLRTAPNPPHPNEAERLLLEATGVSMATLLAHPERELSEDARECLEAFLARRLRGEPLQHIFGEWEFFGRTFLADRRALVPRPETELLIEAMLARAPSAETLLDLGTGSGILAITAALELPRLRAIAVDVSLAAATLARENRRRHALASDRVGVFVGRWDQALALDRRFDVILANPPYLDPDEIDSLPVEVRDHDPRQALADPRGAFAAVADVLEIASIRLAPNGRLAMEIGAGQAGEARRLAADANLEVVDVLPDLAGIERVVVARLRSTRSESR